MEVLLTFVLMSVPALSSDACCEEVIGAVAGHTLVQGESLVELARQHNVGYNAITTVNPGQDPFVPTPGAVAVLPTAWIVPRAAAPGTVVVNLSEMRLYLFPLSPGPPLTFPVGVGSEGWGTPLGRFKVVSKQV